MTETPMGGPRIPQTCSEALWPGEHTELTQTKTLEFTMGTAPAPVREALRAILPANAKQVHIVIDWDGDAPATIF